MSGGRRWTGGNTLGTTMPELEHEQFKLLLERLTTLTERSSSQNERSVVQEEVTEKFSFAFVRILELINRNTERLVDFKGEAKEDFREIENIVHEVEADIRRNQESVLVQNRWFQESLRELSASLANLLVEITRERPGGAHLSPEIDKIHVALQSVNSSLQIIGPKVDTIHRGHGFSERMKHLMAIGTGIGLTLGTLGTLIQLGIIHMGLGK